MQAVKNNFWLRRGYAALTFFGYVVTATQAEADAMNSGMTAMKRHETIHLQQARSTNDSWLRFYLLYIWYYVRALPQNRRMKNAAYWLNPFEMEAYGHMEECGYEQNEASEWRKYARMSPKERLMLLKKQKNST